MDHSLADRLSAVKSLSVCIPPSDCCNLNKKQMREILSGAVNDMLSRIGDVTGVNRRKFVRRVNHIEVRDPTPTLSTAIIAWLTIYQLVNPLSNLLVELDDGWMITVGEYGLVLYRDPQVVKYELGMAFPIG